MTVIFLLSAQSIAQSQETSGGITLFLAELFYGKGITITEDMMEPVTLLVRKTAHMAAYAVLFLLSYGTVYYYKNSLAEKWSRLVAYGWTVFYAVTDEIHQIFSGRGAMVTDVFVDALGALIGILLLCAFVKKNKLKRKVIALFGAAGVYVLAFLLFYPQVIKIFL